MDRKPWVATFLIAAVAGLVLWVFTSPGIAARLLGYDISTGILLLDKYEVPLLLILAVAAGYLAPWGFWLWGVAIVSLRLVVGFSIMLYLGFSGQFADFSGDFDARQIAGLAVIQMLVQGFWALLCTAASAAGAWLRRFVQKLSGSGSLGSR